ncbi:MAG: response regulator, partial [Desulfobacterales bacterium]|nr:response regulator [Desulfobacterales bacterium]
QILINLVNNAIKFTEQGEVILLVEEISENLDANKVRLKFSVKDTGIGISPEQLSKLFSSFTQADTSITRRFGGTGLGLVISKQLSEMMGGQIGVDSVLGEGSTFYFTALFEKSIKTQKYNLTLPENLHGTKTLIIDDNLKLRQLLQIVLTDFGLNVDSCDEAELEILKSKPYRLLFIDITMKGADKLIEVIKNDRELSNISIILMTLLGKEDIYDKLKTNDFLIKPLKQTIIFETVLNTLTNISIKPEESKSLNIANVLLVEDNHINQELVKEMLSSTGAIITTADDGKQAVAILKDAEFDIVFMDIQMPQMDGYEATKAIREMGKKLPIIAMTANAMDEDRQRCLEAGMDDYVSKPISIDNLVAIFNKWSNIKNFNNTNKYKLEEADNEFPNEIEGIDINSAIKRAAGNKKLLKKLLIDFRRDYTNAIDEIKEAWEQGEMETVSRIVHTLKGVSGNISANKIHLACIDIENTIKQKDLNNFKPMLSICNEALITVLESIKNIEKKVAENNIQAPKIDNKDIHLILVKLNEMLKLNDLEADEYIDIIKEQLSDFNIKNLIYDLENYISKLDFENAQITLNNIAESIGISLHDK